MCYRNWLLNGILQETGGVNIGFSHPGSKRQFCGDSWVCDVALFMNPKNEIKNSSFAKLAKSQDIQDSL